MTTSPHDVARFHADYDVHENDRIHLFEPIAGFVSHSARVLYPGSYVDIAPSVWFDEVTFVDTDRRAATFFDNNDAVSALVDAKRRALARPTGTARIEFHHLDYRTPLPEAGESFDLLVSLYAGFVSEHCTDHLRIGGTLFVNPSHGDAAIASIDPRYDLAAVIEHDGDTYRLTDDELETHLVPVKQQSVSIETLHESGRGVVYTRDAVAYLFTRRR